MIVCPEDLLEKKIRPVLKGRILRFYAVDII